MEYSTLFLIFSLLLLLTVLLLRRRSSLLHGHLRIPPGTLGLPFLGETLHVIAAYKSSSPDTFINDRVSRLGSSVFTSHVFGHPTVFSSDYETNRFVLMNEGKLFESSYPGSVFNLLGKHSLLVMQGSLHKRLHGLTTRMGSSSFIKDHLMADIDHLIRTNLESWSGRVLLMVEAKKMAFALIVKQLMSLDPCEWTERLRKEFIIVIEGFLTIPSPLLSTTYRRAVQARGKVAKELRIVVRERRRESERGERKNDLLGALLDEESSGGGFSEEEIVDFLVSILLGGYETTSAVMTIAVKFLTETPLALAQLKEEQDGIRSRKGKSEALEWKDYKSMQFTECVVNETLRVANAGSGVFRRAMIDVDIKGYTIPKGWIVFTSSMSVHLNHDHFKDARTFNPWRWQVDSRTENSIHLFNPFGGGPRYCPGAELARVTISIFLHHLVTQFSWVPTEEDKLVFFPTARMQKGYPIIVQRLNLQK